MELKSEKIDFFSNKALGAAVTYIGEYHFALFRESTRLPFGVLANTQAYGAYTLTQDCLFPSGKREQFKWPSPEHAYHAQKILLFATNYPSLESKLLNFLKTTLETYKPKRGVSSEFLPEDFDELLITYLISTDSTSYGDSKAAFYEKLLGKQFELLDSMMETVIDLRLEQHPQFAAVARYCLENQVIPLEVTKDEKWGVGIKGDGNNLLSELILKRGQVFFKNSNFTNNYQEIKKKLGQQLASNNLLTLMPIQSKDTKERLIDDDKILKQVLELSLRDSQINPQSKFPRIKFHTFDQGIQGNKNLKEEVSDHEIREDSITSKSKYKKVKQYTAKLKLNGISINPYSSLIGTDTQFPNEYISTDGYYYTQNGNEIFEIVDKNNYLIMLLYKSSYDSSWKVSDSQLVNDLPEGYAFNKTNSKYEICEINNLKYSDLKTLPFIYINKSNNIRLIADRNGEEFKLQKRGTWSDTWSSLPNELTSNEQNQIQKLKDNFVKDLRTGLHYQHASMDKSYNRYHFYNAMPTKDINKKYSKYTGDELKTRILLDFRKELEESTDIDDTVIKLKASKEYKVLKQGQGIFTSMTFGLLKTSSVKAFEEMVEEIKNKSKLKHEK